MARMTISESTREYETRLRTQLGEEIVEKDLRAKHRKMADGPFSFLRATYWRWAETILDLCPELTGAPPVLAVGDIHLENFGTWRDAEGRLVWGVNDFDEAAEMPYVFDLVRLATSAVLARAHGRTHAKICAQVFNGYLLGLANPRPVVLDHDHAWLRRLVVVSEGERKRFWQKMDALAAGETAPPPRYVAALAAAMPDPGIEMVIRRRKAGAGSSGPSALGRDRTMALRAGRARGEGNGAAGLDARQRRPRPGAAKPDRQRQISRARPVARTHRQHRDPPVVAEQSQDRGGRRRRSDKAGDAGPDGSGAGRDPSGYRQWAYRDRARPPTAPAQLAARSGRERGRFRTTGLQGMAGKHAAKRGGDAT